MDTVKLYNVDCLGEQGLSTIANKSIDMILCDPPYAITANKWDKPVDLEKMFKEYDRIIKDDGAIVVFGNQPFTTDVINAYRKNFRYSLVWDKNMGTDFFNCNRKPLKSHEDIIVFYKNKPTYNPQKEEGKPYNNNYGNRKWKKEGLAIGKDGYPHKADETHSTTLRFPKSVIKVDYTEDDEYEMEEHEDIIVFYKKQPTYNPQKEEGQKPYKNIRKQIDIPYMQDRKFRFTEVIENKDGTRFPKSVIKVGYTEADEYEMEEHEDIIVFYKKQPTYNPQKEEGKAYNKTMQGKKCSSSGIDRHTERCINDGKRFPKTVLKYKRETGKHTTQKPVKLCEWLIKTYTDEGQTVLDNTMGSGTTGVACVNTNRKFIGFELNEKYFETSQERINEAQKHLNRIKNELQDNTGNQSQSESHRGGSETINPQR
jgi:site-specific DNA-methyltransferase (adenine-specific)